MKKYCFLLFAFSSIFFYSQNIDLPKIVPPSPTAYELGKYGQVPVGMFTGTPNVSIPLYTYNTRNLSVPISLSYSSNGIKVDQLSSNVGLGWSLNAGGVISRVIRDKPDEERVNILPDKEIHEVGFYSQEAMDFLFAAGGEDADTETDIYMYNFMGHSGKFLFDNKKKQDIVGEYSGILMMPQNGLKVEMILDGFEITTPDGVVYSFKEQEITGCRTYGSGQHSVPEVPAITAWYLTKIEHPKGDIVNFIYEESNSFTYDIGISDALSVLMPYFQYGCQNYAGSQNVNSTYSRLRTLNPKRLIKISSNEPDFGEVLFESNVSHPEISSFKLISSIIVKDNAPVPATKSQFDFNYITTDNDRILLNEIQYLDPEKSYSFDYYNPSEIPARLTNSTDYYGYYNGKANLGKNRYPNPNDPFIRSYIYPQFLYYSLSDDGSDKTIDPTKAINGLLKEVHYPTKGYNEFEYEANSYNEMTTVYPNEHNVHLNLSAISEYGDVPQVVEDIGQTQKIIFDQLVKFKLNIGLPYDPHSPCHTSPPSKPLKVRLSITDDLNNNIDIMRETVSGMIVIPNNTLFQVGYPSPNDYYSVEFKKDRIYTFTLSTEWKCTETWTDIVYRSSDTPYEASQNITTGGMRLKRVKSFDTPTSLAPNNIVRYYYGKKDDLSVSSGQKGPRPYYITNSIYRESCSGADYDITYQSLNSNSVRQLYNSSDSGSINYKYVTVSYGGDNFEGGGVENEYLIMPDVQGNIIHGAAIDGSPWVNSGWGNGLLKRETVFKKEDNEILLLKEVSNSYKKVDSVFARNYGYTVNKMFQLTKYIDITYNCTQEDVLKHEKDWYCATNHKHVYLIHDIPFLPNTPTRNCIASGHNMKWRWVGNPCYQKPVNHLIIYDKMLENLNIMEYSNNSYWFYQNSSITKEYDDNGNFAQTTTYYYYDNPQHLQQTRVEKTTSTDNKKLIVQTDYANDLGIQGLIDDYRIAEPVQTRSFKKVGEGPEQLLSTQRTEYDNFGGQYLPKFIQTLKGEAQGSLQLESRIIYHSYDGYGNPKEVSKVGGAHISYIWGYHGLYPVAKIENATYAQAMGVGGLNMSIIEDPSTGNLDAELDKIRNGLPNAQVTTLTYIPLVGVHTVTDPKGFKMIYEYDDYGRLQYVMDMDNNVLSENQYRYIND